MEIEDFLKRFIDQYLLRDLASMAAVSPPPGETGACGFSMVLVALAGCELLGSITYPKPFRPLEGRRHFAHFWRSAMYPTDAVRADLAETIYKLVRHGLAHAFITKPRILVTKTAGTVNHLCRQPDGSLTVDCLALAHDFRRGYEQFVLARMSTPSDRAALQRQLDDIQNASWDDSAEHVIRIGSVPDADPNEAQRFIPSGQVMINSPSLQPLFKQKP
jgi:hypothetical protein